MSKNDDCQNEPLSCPPQDAQIEIWVTIFGSP
jgi:hypothetical protein